MYRDELLEAMRAKISQYYYDILVMWTKKREKTLFGGNQKFDVQPTIGGYGYIITCGWEIWGNYIIVYNLR
jgi:hypothetical protein